MDNHDIGTFPDESGILPIPTDENIPVHSTPIKSSVPPFSTKKRCNEKKTTGVNPQGTGHHRDSQPIEEAVNSSGTEHAIAMPLVPKTPPRGTSQHPQVVSTMRQNKQSYSPGRGKSVSIATHKSIGANQVREKFSLSLQDTNLENTTIEKQRREIQLLVSELKDRDRELNDMMSAHQHQLVAWEQDRQKLLLLEQKYAKCQGDLYQRTKQFKNVLMQLKAVRNESNCHSSTLENTQEILSRLTEESSQHMTLMKELEETNKNLNSSNREMSSKIGQLQAKEQELSTMLRLKEKDLSEATIHIGVLNSRLKQLDVRAKECQDREVEMAQQCNNWRQKHSDTKLQLDQKTDQLEKKERELENHIQKSNQLQQQMSRLHEDHFERESCKEEVIESMKAKQARSDYQLTQLRELYERQHRELTLLQLNLDTSKEIIAKQQYSLEDYNTSRGSGSTGSTPAHDVESPSQNYPPKPVSPRSTSTKKQSHCRGGCGAQLSPQFPLAKSNSPNSSIEYRQTENKQPSQRRQEMFSGQSQQIHSRRDQNSFGKESETMKRKSCRENEEENGEEMLFGTPPLQGNYLKKHSFNGETNNNVHPQVGLLGTESDKYSAHKDRRVDQRGVTPGSPSSALQTDNRVSFEERLSTFLDDEGDVGEMTDNVTSACHAEASPGRKLQRLLVESRKMIENLEMSSNPVSLFKENHIEDSS